tara:strand:+ start:5116 stop:6105 length:990 start_codon:yes stop_codon:yes gene_type:complete
MENGVQNKILMIFTLSFSFYVCGEEYQQEKTWFGDPDLQGVWTNASLTTLERPDYFETLELSEAQVRDAKYASERFNEVLDNPYEEGATPESGGDVGGYNVAWMDPGNDFMKLNGKYRSSIITYPENGKLPRRLTRWAMEGPFIYRMFNSADHPEERSLGERCIVGFGSSGGPPMLNVLYNNHYQIVQSPGYVMIMVEMNHDARIIRIDQDHNPDNMKPWLGDSIGHWEDNTLVVRTINHHPQQKFRAAIRHQILMMEEAEVIERFTRTSESEILYQFEVKDRKAYRDTWKGEMPLRATNNKIYEYACHEGNYAMANILAGARAEEMND